MQLMSAVKVLSLRKKGGNLGSIYNVVLCWSIRVFTAPTQRVSIMFLISLYKVINISNSNIFQFYT